MFTTLLSSKDYTCHSCLLKTLNSQVYEFKMLKCAVVFSNERNLNHEMVEIAHKIVELYQAEMWPSAAGRYMRLALKCIVLYHL